MVEPDTTSFPTIRRSDPSNVRLLSTVALGAVPFNVITPLSVVPVRVSVPDVPLLPEVPDDPLVPEVPALPLVPDVPLLPDVPALPLVPELPLVPDVPLLPDVPEVPELPLVPDVPLLPEVPELPLLPELPAVPEVPEVPDVPAGVNAKFANDADTAKLAEGTLPLIAIPGILPVLINKPLSRVSVTYYLQIMVYYISIKKLINLYFFTTFMRIKSTQMNRFLVNLTLNSAPQWRFH